MAENDELDWVRVSDRDTGHRRSVRRIQVPHGNYEVLDEPAIHDDPADSRYGDPLPPEYGVDTPEPTGHAAATVPELRAEIARRNTDRPEDARIVVGGRGNKPDLVAALEDDDQAQAAAAAANPAPADPPAGDGEPVDHTPGHEATDTKEQH